MNACGLISSACKGPLLPGVAWRGLAWRGVAWRGVSVVCDCFYCLTPARRARASFGGIIEKERMPSVRKGHAVHKADTPERKMCSNIPNVAGLFAFKSSFCLVRIDDKSKRPPINNSRPGDPSNLTRRLREGASNDKRFAPRLSALLVLMVH